MAKALNNQDLIRKLKPNPLKPFYRRAVHSHVGSGLYVKVTAAAGRKYVARYIIKGKPVDVTIGNAMSMTLQEAKDKHLEGYNLAADGLDPRLSWQARIKSNEQATTMQSLFDEWLQFYGATPSQRPKRSGSIRLAGTDTAKPSSDRCWCATSTDRYSCHFLES